ncbi:hypothetical protein [Heyndrickxia acidicola]|uniref:LTXXQ motif family protein n=1 Tax=Heyndrickxia acidicola TaxID=209389 RepID=A0ABU6MKB3_9BACI|nr:hypothetical protein [Heyndrickxia acidicola]MED1203490.1 hypothetical protein [Heyndrickxia acidicola]
MKAKSSLIVPVLAAALAIPTIGHTMTDHKNNTSNASASMHQKYEKGSHKKWGKDGNRNELINEIKQYASPQLQDQLKKDLTQHESLMKELRQTPAFQKKMEQKKAEEQAFFKAHKQEIDAIKQEVKDGKLTKQQAHKKLEALFGNKAGKGHHMDKGKEHGKNGLFTGLKTALQKKDTAAINSILEKFDQQLEKSNQQLQQQINANK